MRAFWLVICANLIATPVLAAEVKEVVTPGGLTAWLIEEHALPLIAVKISFRGSGSAHDAKGAEGRANMVAALLSEGAGDMDARALNDALESHAVQINSTADDDVFDVSMETLSEHKNPAFSYLGLMLAAPRFDEASIERTRRQTLSLLVKQNEKPGYLLQQKWQQLAFGEHPYSNPQLGTESSINALSRDMLKDYAKRYLTRGNIVISVVGDITPGELSELLDRNLSSLPETYAPDTTVAEIAIPAGGEPVIIPFDIPQTMVTFGAAGLKRSDPDYFPAFVMNQILGGGGSLTARLGVEIREKRGLAYSVSSYLNPMAHSASWAGGFSTRNEQAGTAYDTLKTTLHDFVQKGATDKEIADAKQYLTGSFVLNLDSNADIASFLTTMQINRLGIDYLAKRNAMVQAVGKDSVNAIARKLIDPDKLIVVMIGKPNLTSGKR